MKAIMWQNHVYAMDVDEGYHVAKSCICDGCG